MTDNSPLFYAIKMDNKEAIEAFADKDISKFGKCLNSQGLNAVLYAAKLQNWEMVNYLTSRGVSASVQDPQG